MTQAEELESAILERAHRLAEEYKSRAERSRDNIRKETSERLRLREEREVLVAKALADRTYRRKVQANELKLQSQMDILRWNLVLGVTHGLSARMQELAGNHEAYLEVLKNFLFQGAALIKTNELIVEVNHRDHELLEPLWADIVQECAAGKTLTLSPEPIDSVGGLLIRSTDNRIRLDNTFKGRMERLDEKIHRLVMERLFPGSGPNESGG